MIAAIEDETDIPDSKDAIEKAMEAKQEYDALDEEQKALVGEEKAQLLTELYDKAVNFVIIKGADSEYVQNSGKGLSFTANGAFDFFTAVKVDGNVIDAKNYTAKSGSTIVELTEDYLMTLKVGTHTFEVMYEVLEEHRADCSFTVKEAPVADDESKDETPKDETPKDETSKDDETTDTNSPTTGDDSNIFGWMCMMIVSAMTIILSCKKRRKN